MGNPPQITTDVRLASMRQIHTAIEHFHKQEFECAITLAGAAEGMLPNTNQPHFRQKVNELSKLPEIEAAGGATGANDFINWLKHGQIGKGGPRTEDATITELEVIAVIWRAITKFQANYSHLSPQMLKFAECVKAHLQNSNRDSSESQLSLTKQKVHAPSGLRPSNSSCPSPGEAVHRYRSHTCGELRASDVGGDVRLSGWCHRIRDHGGVLFVDLRDHYGITQCVIDPDSPAFPTAETLRSEWVVRIDGKLRLRPPGTENPDLPTGAVEVYASEIEVLGPAAELPMPVFGEQEYPEDIRLRYRFLDLRRERLHRNIMLRGAIIDSIRRRMKEQGFFEFQTPILTASSPEGARDFLVPSRLHPGKFYALPQAPQQFKQLVMISGFDRYFQIAPCFRDEDARADRSPGEFYQLDLEMSFVTQDDVFAAVEPVLRGLFEEFAGGKPVTQKFPRIKYGDSVRRYGTDKPDLRNPIVMQNVTGLFRGSGFKVFANRIDASGDFEVWGIPAPGGGNRAFCDRMNAWAQGEGQPGLGYIFWREGEEGGAGPIAKNLGPERTEAIRSRFGLCNGDAIFFSAGKTIDFVHFAGFARTKIGNELNLIDKDRFEFCWIVDFPMFGWNPEEKKIEFSHNPFSMPNMNLDEFLALDPTNHERILEIKAIQYDVVCNGIELSSGAIRNHRPDVMKKAFAIAGYGEEVLEQKFGGMLRALALGAPPHGGIAPGIDRMVMLLAGEENLREVVLFPMNQRAEDLLMGAPSEVALKQLRELHIRLNLPSGSSKT